MANWYYYDKNGQKQGPISPDIFIENEQEKSAKTKKVKSPPKSRDYPSLFASDCGLPTIARVVRDAAKPQVLQLGDGRIAYFYCYSDNWVYD